MAASELSELFNNLTRLIGLLYVKRLDRATIEKRREEANRAEEETSTKTETKKAK